MYSGVVSNVWPQLSGPQSRSLAAMTAPVTNAAVIAVSMIGCTGEDVQLGDGGRVMNAEQPPTAIAAIAAPTMNRLTSMNGTPASSGASYPIGYWRCASRIGRGWLSAAARRAG
jgi:hypothetical protein